MHGHRLACRRRALVLAAALAIAGPAHAGDAKGTLTYKGRSVELKHAYLVKGPTA